MNESSSGLEPRGPDLTRTMLLHLSKRECSPPEPLFVSLSELVGLWRTSGEDIAQALEFLSARGFIEGPGWLDDDVFLFRKVTAKGRMLARAIDSARDWKAIKAHYLSP